jgi:hypothetical protein
MISAKDCTIRVHLHPASPASDLRDCSAKRQSQSTHLFTFNIDVKSGNVEQNLLSGKVSIQRVHTRENE